MADYEIAKTKIDMSMFEELPNLKQTTLKALVRDLADTQRHDEKCEKLRFKKPWVQSNSFTDQLAADARVLRMVSSSVMDSEGKDVNNSSDYQGIIFREHPVIISNIMQYI